ncbi:MFS transporter [Nonomuraea sp. NPDC050202]|uniref:MFS transporter n=1 Tax=Nonomuraea sp. NPDC050202 TaxID=3155035 RepID=UPI00340BBE6D
MARATYWACAWWLPFPALAGAATTAGLLGLPVYSVTRQCLAAMVPEQQRHVGFTLDSMLVELSYMAGPALAVASMTTLGSGATMMIIGGSLAIAGLALIMLSPLIRSTAEEVEHRERAGSTPRRQWFTPAFAALLGAAMAAMFILTATELALVATMTHAHQTAWTGLAIAIWCAYSLVGGFVYGGLRRGFSPLTLTAVMGLLTVPVGLASGDWRWLLLALLPSGMLVAPVLASTMDMISKLVPPRTRGEAIGFHGTALLIGGAATAPISGVVIDGLGPEWAFTVAGLGGMAMVLAVPPLWRRRAARTISAPVAEFEEVRGASGPPQPLLSGERCASLYEH